MPTIPTNFDITKLAEMLARDDYPGDGEPDKGCRRIKAVSYKCRLEAHLRELREKGDTLPEREEIISRPGRPGR